MDIYQVVGGEKFFTDLVDRFYTDVEQDPLLAPMYPQDDMEGARRRLKLFLMQYFGGPGTYSEERGHPRLRMRHMPFAIGQAERDAWMKHMSKSLDQAEIDPDAKAQMAAYFDHVATFMMNR